MQHGTVSSLPSSAALRWCERDPGSPFGAATFSTVTVRSDSDCRRRLNPSFRAIEDRSDSESERRELEGPARGAAGTCTPLLRVRVAFEMYLSLDCHATVVLRHFESFTAALQTILMIECAALRQLRTAA